MENKRGLFGLGMKKLITLFLVLMAVIMIIAALAGFDMFSFFKNVLPSNFGLGSGDNLLEEVVIAGQDVQILISDGSGRCVIVENLSAEGWWLKQYGVREEKLEWFNLDSGGWGDVDDQAMNARIAEEILDKYPLNVSYQITLSDGQTRDITTEMKLSSSGLLVDWGYEKDYQYRDGEVYKQLSSTSQKNYAKIRDSWTVAQGSFNDFDFTVKDKIETALRESDFELLDAEIVGQGSSEYILKYLNNLDYALGDQIMYKWSQSDGEWIKLRKIDYNYLYDPVRRVEVIRQEDIKSDLMRECYID